MSEVRYNRTSTGIDAHSKSIFVYFYYDISLLLILGYVIDRYASYVIERVAENVQQVTIGLS